MTTPVRRLHLAPPYEGLKYWFTLPADAHTLDGFRRWAVPDDYPETGRVSYIAGGIFVDMSPGRIGSHGGVKTAIVMVLHGLVRRARTGTVNVGDVLVSSGPGSLSSQPDAVYVSYGSIQTGRVRMTPTADGED